MAAKVIARLNCWYTDGRWQPMPGYELDVQALRSRMDHLARDAPAVVQVTVREPGKPRTTDQNRLMWQLLHRLALAMDGDKLGGTTAEQCYLDLLEQAGIATELWTVPRRAVPALRQAYRVVQMVELLDRDRCVVRLGDGSSSFDTRQMSAFIELIFDRLAELGVQDADARQAWRDWRDSHDMP